jgi:glycosyltransferase involved in cell wall biosynthesis
LLVLLREGFDVVHCAHPPDTFVFITAFYKILGKRYVLDHHDLAPELYYARFKGKGNGFVHRTLLALEKIACGLANHVIATNQSYKHIEMQRGRVPEWRISVVRNGPDLNELRCPNAGVISTKNAKVVLGYVGVMGTQDGVDYLLRALKRLVYDLGRSDFTSILVGSGNALPSLKSLAQNLDLTEYVQFTGWVTEQSEVARYISSMDICIAPEPSDPYNDRSTAAKVMEYMALGKPTVAFDLPEHRFTAQEAALYARPNDELDLARKIASLMDAPEQREIMGTKGRERIAKELAWLRQGAMLIEAYDALFTQGRVH